MSAPSLSLLVFGAPLAARTADMARSLAGAGWSVRVAASPSALAWLDAGGIEGVTGAPPLVELRDPGEAKRAPRPDVVVACPITFNSVNKAAAGISDVYAIGVLNEAIAARVPVIAVPMVSNRLWGHPAWEPSLRVLSGAGVEFLDVHTGRPGTQPVESGTGERVVEHFDAAWLGAAAERFMPSS